MDKLKQKAIEHHYADLVQSMDPLSVMDHLRAGLLSLEERETIREALRARRERNRELIAFLFRKREELKPFECFVKALEKTDDNHEAMAKHILRTYGSNAQPGEEFGNPTMNQNHITQQSHNAGASAQRAKEHDAALEIDKIINKFEQLSREKASKLKRPLTDILKNGLNDSRVKMSTRVDLEDLLNKHTSSVLTDSAIEKIRSASHTSDAFYVFCEALERSSIYALIMFLIGLKSNKQEHLFHLFCTEEFCNDLLSAFDRI